MKKIILAGLTVLVVTLGVALTAIWYLDARDAAQALSAPPAVPADPSSPDLIKQGAYLARTGNCMTCHTARGGLAFAGGRGIETPFGTVFSSNLTTDPITGIGQWSAADFWRALHHGRSRDGRLLYPAFPYTSYTQLTRPDSDALFAYLHSLPAVAQNNLPHTLRWPYNTPFALATWRALYFNPGVYQADTTQSAAWNRGAYLVRGLGHCAACHTARNALGGSDAAHDLGGGLMPVQDWYAPSLTSHAEAGVAAWSTQEIVQLLETGWSARGSVSGPMADVVLHSTQYWSPQDLLAAATFLKTLTDGDAVAPGAAPTPLIAPQVASQMTGQNGARLYEKYCAQCHGLQGEGIPNAYPALAGNRAVNLPVTANLIQLVLKGGFAPATQGNPRPFGMPPFALVLNDRDMADVLTHIRTSWNNQATPLTELEVNRFREKLGQSGR